MTANVTNDTPERSDATLSAHVVVEELKACGASHVVWLPDSESKHLYNLLVNDPELKLVPICREGEALGIALGLLVGGMRPVVVIQNTGLFESGDSIRGLGLNLSLPILMLVSYRGWHRDAPITDTAAIYLEPVLRGWRLPYHFVRSDSEAHIIGQAYEQARASSQITAVLMAQEYV